MATEDDMQAFLQVMANLHTLSTPDAAQKVTGELLTLRKRSYESQTVINRLTEDNASFINELKTVAEGKRAMDIKVKRLEEELALLKKDCAEINKVADERGQEAREKSERVAQLEQHRVNLVRSSKGDVGTRWFQLWTTVKQLSTAFFSEDLDERTLRDAHDFDPSVSHQYAKGFPAPANNSTEAKQMRIVAVNSIIANALAQNIFRGVGMNSGLEAAVSHLAGVNPDMESFYRSSHLAILENLPEYSLSVSTRAIKATITQVMSAVGCILSAENKLNFQTHLEKVCHTAAQEWQAFQRYDERYEIDMEGNKSCYDHVTLWKPSTPKTNGAAKTPSPVLAQNGHRAAEHAEVKTPSAAVVVSVWPLLKVVGPEGAVPRISGMALFSDQTRRAEEQVRRESRKASREEGKQDDRKSRPASLGSFLPGSSKVM